MRAKLERSRGGAFLGSGLLELARRGVSRELGYEWVQRNAMRAFAGGRDVKPVLAAGPEIAGVLNRAEIDRAFDLDEQFRYVDNIFERVFQCEPVSSSR